MKKMNSTLRVLVAVITCCFFGTSTFAQFAPGTPVPARTVSARLNVVSSGFFPAEVGYSLNGAGITTPISVPNNGAPAALNIGLAAAGGAYTFTGTDTFGDGWNDAGLLNQATLAPAPNAAGCPVPTGTPIFSQVWLNGGAGPTVLAPTNPNGPGAGGSTPTPAQPNIPATTSTFVGAPLLNLSVAIPVPACTAAPGTFAAITSSTTGVVCVSAVGGAGLTLTAGNPNSVGNYSGTFPAGLTIVTLTTLNNYGYVMSQQFGITGAATPQFNNPPANQTIVLDPGDCDKALNFQICATSCSGFACASGELATQCQTTFRQNGVVFNLTNTSTKQMVITSFEVNPIRDGNYPVGAVTNVEVYVRQGAGNTTFVGAPANAATWGALPIASGSVGTSTDACDAAKQRINLPGACAAGSLTLNPGQTRAVHVRSSNGSAFATPFLGAAQGVFPKSDGNLTITPGSLTAFLYTQNFPNFTFDGAVNYQTISTTLCLGDPACGTGGIIQTAGPGPLTPGGATWLFPRGTTNLGFSAVDVCGTAATLNFGITILEYPNPISQLSCNDNVQVSLDENCEALIGADDILEGGPYGCYDDYIVEVYQNGKLIPGSPLVGETYIGQTLTVKVIDPDTGNSCWGTITIEDKLPPVLTCVDQAVPCGIELIPGAAFTGKLTAAGTPLPTPTGAVGTVAVTFNVAGLPNTGAPIPGFDLNVPLRITHQWIGLVEAKLTAPNGVSVTLQDNAGPAPFGCNLNTTENVTFDDQAPAGPLARLNPTIPAAGCAAATFQGSKLVASAAQALANFNNGTNLNGTWTLEISITASGIAAGTINFSELQFQWSGVLYDPGFNVDACCTAEVNFTDVTLFDNQCTGPFIKSIRRTWVAEDCSGNKAQCNQIINIAKATIGSLVLPPNYDDLDEPALDCTDAYPTPDVTGRPGGLGCNIQATYVDLVIPVCQNSYKIVRTWTILDWCTGQIATYQQIIKLLDKFGPDFVCPTPAQINVIGYTKPNQYHGCLALVQLPWIPISDNCSTFNNIDVVVSTVDAKGILYSATDPGADGFFELELPTGTYTFTYTATDDCGNISFCTVVKQIKDDEAPVAVCDDKHNVSLTDSVTVVAAEAFDDGSFDECGPVTFLARRLDNPKCQGNDATPFGPTVPFYCCDAKGGQDVTVELRVIDLDGNINTCWSVVLVEDKIRPTVVCPPDITVWCGQPYTPTNLDTTIVTNVIDAKISEIFAKKYQFPLDVEGFPKGAIIRDLDLGLDITHGFTNQLEIALISPFGVRSTVMTTNSCPNQYGEDINVVFNDQAYDINIWNNFQIKSPADFVCVPKIPTIGSYNKGLVIGGSDDGVNYTVGQMRTQADKLKVFNGFPLNNENFKLLFANVQFNEINANTNRLSSFEIFNLLNALGLTTGQRITLRYDSNTGGPINALVVGSYYIFRVVDAFTIELLPENGTDIVSVPVGSSHKFEFSTTWVLQVYDNAPLAGGKVNQVDLHITWGLPTALRPTAKDNTEACGIMFSWTDLDQPDPCYNNVIRRRWVATDMFTNSRACIQRVSFEDETPLVVQFPCDVTVTCGPNGTVSLAGFDINTYLADKANQPLHSGDCESVGIEPIIHELTVVPDACRKYIVKWKVIDWCEYDKNATTQTPGGIALSFADLQEWFPTLPWHNQCNYFIPGFPFNILAFEDDGDGYFEHTQYIKLIDTSKPVITNKDTTICSYGPCQENVTLTANATDVCTPSTSLTYRFVVDAFNDGTNDITSPFNVNSPIFNATVPFGKHRITWTVTDGCGNFSTSSYIFFVKDCKKPTPICINGLSAPNMPVQKMVSIWASDWVSNSSVDNCCATADLVYRVEKTKTSNGVDVPTTTVVTFDCTELGSQPVRVWAGDCGYDENGNGTIEDSERNWDFCETFILITDNDGVCPNVPMAAVVGTTETETGKAVTGVNLTAGSYNLTSASNGQFSFLLPTQQAYTIVPVKDVNPLNGVNTLDVINITNHILGKKALGSPYQMIAADVNKSKKISAADLVQIRQLILNITTEFSNNTSWRFVDKAYKFTTNDPLSENFPEVIQINKLTTATSANFISVKVGDVTNNANGSNATGDNETRSANKLTLATADQDVAAGQEVKVNFTAKDFTNIAGYQFTIGFDVDALDFVGIEGVAADITGENFGLTHLENGKITTSWNGKSITTLSDNEVLFTVTFKANKSAKLSQAISVNSSLTPAMAFDANEEAMDVALVFNNNNGTVTSNNFALYQNEPNPFKEFTTIKFDLPEASKATLTIYDVTGKVVKAINGDFAKGSNLVRIERSEIPAAGTMYYQLDTDTNSAVKKMIIID